MKQVRKEDDADGKSKDGKATGASLTPRRDFMVQEVQGVRI